MWMLLYRALGTEDCWGGNKSSLILQIFLLLIGGYPWFFRGFKCLRLHMQRNFGKTCEIFLIMYTKWKYCTVCSQRCVNLDMLQKPISVWVVVNETHKQSTGMDAEVLIRTQQDKLEWKHLPGVVSWIYHLSREVLESSGSAESTRTAKFRTLSVHLEPLSHTSTNNRLYKSGHMQSCRILYIHLKQQNFEWLYCHYQGIVFWVRVASFW